MSRYADSLILGGAILLLFFAAGEFAARLAAEAPWICSTDAECEAQAAYVDAHRGGRP